MRTTYSRPTSSSRQNSSQRLLIRAKKLCFSFFSYSMIHLISVRPGWQYANEASVEPNFLALMPRSCQHSATSINRALQRPSSQRGRLLMTDSIKCTTLPETTHPEVKHCTNNEKLIQKSNLDCCHNFAKEPCCILCKATSMSWLLGFHVIVRDSSSCPFRNEKATLCS